MNQFTVSLWGDEGFAATLAIKPIIQIIKIVSRDTSPPLYYLCLHFWMKFFGTSEVAIRSLSFLFFLGTVLTVFLIGKYLWDKKTGILAALLTFANPFLFTYAFEGRMYAILAFTSILAVYFFLKKNQLGFILAATAALYSHHFSIFILGFLGIWDFWEAKFRFKEAWIIKPAIIVALLYLPWLYPLYYQTSLVGSGFWLGRPATKDFLGVVVKFLVGEPKTMVQRVALGLVLLTVVLRGIKKSKKVKKDKKETIFLLGWFFAPLALTFIISQFFQSIFYDRYMLASIPAAFLLLASNRKKVSIILITLIILLLGYHNWQYFTHPNKRPFRELANFVKEEKLDLPLINYNAAAHHLWESKYYGIPAPIYASTPLPFYTGTALMEESDQIRTLPNSDQILAISSAWPDQVEIEGYGIAKSESFSDQLWLVWMKKK